MLKIFRSRDPTSAYNQGLLQFRGAVGFRGAVQFESPVESPVEVKSPIVGVFYSAHSPDAEPFVSIGAPVKKGDVLCIIETMKLLNEITADRDGMIADVCLKNGDVVEYGQVLFKLT